MDWQAAIDKHRDALRRVLSALVAMAGLGDGHPPLACRPSPPQGGSLAGITLPRHRHRAMLRVLRPAEAAVRRLIIVAARGLVVPPPAPRPRRPKPAPTILRRPGGTGVFLSVRRTAGDTAPRALALPLLDPPRRRPRPARPVQSVVPRISVPGAVTPFPVPERRPPSRYDKIDATRLFLRLAALATALDDIAGQARRFARWRCRIAGAQQENAAAQSPARKDTHRNRRVWPLRTGRPPGQSRAERHRPSHEIQTILTDVHGLAFWALEAPDTS